jgi:hypothetical protein
MRRRCALDSDPRRRTRRRPVLTGVQAHSVEHVSLHLACYYRPHFLPPARFAPERTFRFSPDGPLARPPGPTPNVDKDEP